MIIKTKPSRFNSETAFFLNKNCNFDKQNKFKMNISIFSKRQNDKLVKYLIKSQKELIKECHEDFKTKVFQDSIARLRAKNKLQYGV